MFEFFDSNACVVDCEVSKRPAAWATCSQKDRRRYGGRGGATSAAIQVATLLNMAGSDPFIHAGQFLILGEVLIHYNVARPRRPARANWIRCA